MGANEWSAVAAACSAIAAAVSLAVASHAKRIQGRSADFANCIEVVERLGVAQRRVRDAPDNHYEFEFRELLNLLEALALLHNDSKIVPSTRKVVEKFLAEAIAWMRRDERMKQLMAKAMTGATTFAELEKFETRQGAQIRAQAKLSVIEKGLR